MIDSWDTYFPTLKKLEGIAGIKGELMQWNYQNRFPKNVFFFCQITIVRYIMLQ